MVAEEIQRNFDRAIDYFTAQVHAVRDDQWTASTPCSEWSVRDLVNHLTINQLWVKPLVTDGATIAEVADTYAGDQLGDDPVAAWDRAAEASRHAFEAPDALDRIVHLPYGDSPAAAYCREMMADAAIHGWDLARAIGGDEAMPNGLASAALSEAEAHADELAQSGMFADPMPPPADADTQTRLLCLTGRHQ
ncbi:TIGR03086 family metal-binding protein [Streptomyces sp. NPDC056661]|uniref:TIGR03086 family metal-binding protein n=1 Tax=Streptomyces sp. NPDC056661 TaxID=3345898 RepID=UPI0036BEDCE0